MLRPDLIGLERRADGLKDPLGFHLAPESHEVATQSDCRTQDQSDDPKNDNHLKKGESLRTRGPDTALMLKLNFH